MSWNNRIVKRKDGWYAVHEVYYNEDGEAYGMTLEPAFRLMVNPDDPICGCDPEEIRDALKLMLRDVEKDLGDRGIFEEPDEWADDGYEDTETILGAAIEGTEILEVLASTKELAQQVADMESEGGLIPSEELTAFEKGIDKTIDEIPDSTRELAWKVVKQLEEKLGKETTPEELEAWAKKLADDISSATD